MSDEKMREADLSDRFDEMCARWDITDESNNFGLLFMSFKEGWKTSAAHSAARIAELEGQVAMLRDALNHPKLFTSTAAYNQLVEALSATAQTAEQYKRRVQAQALEELANRFMEIANEYDPVKFRDEALHMASELRNPAAQAEGKGEK